MPVTITKAQENDLSLRTCTKCGNVITLLGTIDEHGNKRDYNRMPASRGLCACIGPRSYHLPGWPEGVVGSVEIPEPVPYSFGCRAPGCDGDPDDGEGWNGFCGNCADRVEAFE